MTLPDKTLPQTFAVMYPSAVVFVGITVCPSDALSVKETEQKYDWKIEYNVIKWKWFYYFKKSLEESKVTYDYARFNIDSEKKITLDFEYLKTNEQEKEINKAVPVKGDSKERELSMPTTPKSGLSSQTSMKKEKVRSNIPA
mgnify:CR=1 FL=1